MTSTARIPRARLAALLVWIALKVVLFLLLGRTDTARFVYAGF